MSINCTVNKGVIDISRRSAPVYQSTIEYVLAHLQKHMHLLFNPIYEQVLPTEHNTLHFYSLD